MPVQMYVDAGCDLNIKSTTGNTVLHYIFDAVLHIKGPEVPLEHKRGRQASMSKLSSKITTVDDNEQHLCACSLSHGTILNQTRCKRKRKEP